MGNVHNDFVFFSSDRQTEGPTVGQDLYTCSAAYQQCKLPVKAANIISKT